MKLHQFTSYAQAGALITNNNGEQINLISIDIYNLIDQGLAVEKTE